MKYTWMFLIVLLVGVSVFAVAEEAPDLTPVMCETLSEVNQAKSKSVPIIKFQDRYWIKVGIDYKGNYRTLDAAQTVYLQNAMKQVASPQAVGEQVKSATPDLKTFYNPELVLFPFTDLVAEKGLQFTAPEETVVPASMVMIHPEPLIFDKVSFGPVSLNAMMQQMLRRQMRQNPGMEVKKLPARKNLFVVTGQIAARTGIAFSTGALDLSVGLAVIGTDGEPQLKHYGDVDNDLGFRCMAEIDHSTIKPQTLLLFLIGKGTMAEMLRPLASIPKKDASPFEYHVLASLILEMGENWFPPLDEATQEEAQKLMDEMKRARGGARR